jgi:hypothetical protein
VAEGGRVELNAARVAGQVVLSVTSEINIVCTDVALFELQNEDLF